MDEVDYATPDEEWWAGLGVGPLLKTRPEVPQLPDPGELAAQDQEEAAARRFRALVNEQKQRISATRTAQRELDAEEAEASKPEPVAPLNWSTFLTEELPPPDWHAGRLYAQGEQVSLVGEGKAGKSMFAMEMAWRDAAGLPFLGDKPRRPRRVMYVDHENGHRDIQSRFRSFGATPETMGNLVYLSFPPHRPLDTEAGAAEFLADVERHKPDVVYLDTVSRVISGEENGSDAWLKLYRLVLMKLKARGISSVRLDHFGKDTERGARGNSAKTQDIDVTWELRVADKNAGILTLTRTFTRNGIGRGFYRIERRGELVADQWRPGATVHVLAAEQDTSGGPARPGEFIGAAHIADQLDAAGIPVDLGRDKVREILRTKHPEISCNNTLLGDAIKLRKERRKNQPSVPQDELPDPPTFDSPPIQRCHRCGLLPGEERHEVVCVYGESSVEHVAAVLGMPAERVAQYRADWQDRAA
ncbi:AAA family ATPase [Micromonospora carbonacea]|uniref:AAA family ATPase n=1 Tax=Micromonospora carbonacea TaxID=47853 RepID=UPI0037226303